MIILATPSIFDRIETLKADLNFAKYLLEDFDGKLSEQELKQLKIEIKTFEYCLKVLGVSDPKFEIVSDR